MSGTWGDYQYVTVAERKQQAEKALKKLKKANPDIEPIIIQGRSIATTWWGNAWNQNLESYADYYSRIGRGRSYVRNGMVLDLRIEAGRVSALVAGSARTPYRIEIKIDPLSDKKWRSVLKQTTQKIGSIAELAEGKFPKELAEVFLRQGDGLFPSPKEIHLSCSCPDWAVLCKHVAAALYAVGARLDQDPLLFFKLRSIPFQELIKKSVDAKVKNMLKNAGKKSDRILKDADISSLFGL